MCCFVCTEPASRKAPLFRVCSCKTFVHEACFRALLERVPSHRGRCAVCLQPYPGVTMRGRVRCDCVCEVVLVYAYCLLLATWAAFALVHHYISAYRGILVQMVTFTIACLAVGLTVSVLAVHRQHILQRSRLCCVSCCSVEHRPVVDTKQLRTPETSPIQAV